jgi:antitoxin VapB
LWGHHDKKACAEEQKHKADERKRLTVKEMLAIGREFRKHIKGPILDHAELLYDERGLPK